MKTEVQRILGEHRVLDHAAAELEAIIGRGQRQAGQAFMSLSRFASSLAEHLMNESHSDAGRPAPSADAAFERELTELRFDWDEYLTAWDERRAANDWPRFAQHSLGILGRVRARIRAENDRLMGRC